MALSALVAVMLLLQPLTMDYPYEITEYNVTVNISEGKVHEEITITVENYDSLPIFEYSFLYPLENLQVYDSQGSLHHEIKNDLLLCYLDIIGSRPYTFTIEFDTSGYISPVKEGKWVFSPIFQFSVPAKNFQIEITVPSEMAVVSPIYPVPTSFYSYRETLVVKWKRDVLSEGEEFMVLLGYKPVSSPDSREFLLYYLTAAVLAGFALGLYVGRKRKPQPEYVVADEQKVLEEIRRAGGRIIQKDLVKNTEFSKSKISKIISDLESRNVVRKKKYKRTNLIFLKE
ncbi:MAG: hypothetical protein HXS41_00285 [Theionarchaea archaeon]|nr:hypothetical protein [Theionarchaea archaeon]MBU7019468.1 hypothetical protein [Theionarchaea archaeon]MBU7035410.1 hypothetical protein [Theionarchaea archaeon]MBU7041233.1 hypothetical protein [Theionarchaea archaeon]